jgi:hypothetical protein
MLTGGGRTVKLGIGWCLLISLESCHDLEVQILLDLLQALAGHERLLGEARR